MTENQINYVVDTKCICEIEINVMITTYLNKTVLGQGRKMKIVFLHNRQNHMEGHIHYI